jgi:MinD-like ATPase involved in chromosome partitioning or flagellar assembly
LLNKPFRAIYSVIQRLQYNKITLAEDGFFHIKYKNKNIILEKSAQPFEIYEQFFSRNPYIQLKVQNKIVVDVGGGVADTAILFMIDHAKRVYVFEPNPKRYYAAKENIKLNKIKGIHIINKEVKSLDDVNSYGKAKRMVLKSDCEGAEHTIFKNSTKKAFERYSEIVMEFHNGYLDIKELLEEAGFCVTYSFSPYYSADFNGILFAYRK